MAATVLGRNGQAEGFADLIQRVSLHLANDNEIAGNNYARAMTDGSQWTIANGVATNNAEISFPTPSAAWGNAVSVRLRNAAGAELTDGDDLTNARDIAPNSNVRFAAGAITVTVPA